MYIVQFIWIILLDFSAIWNIVIDNIKDIHYHQQRGGLDMINQSAYTDLRALSEGISDSSNYIAVSACGHQKCVTKDISILSMPRVRVDWQLIYIVNGAGYFMFDGQKIRLKEGSAVIYAPGDYQAYEYLHREQTEVYWVHFSGFGVETILEDLGLRRAKAFDVGIHSDFVGCYQKAMRAIEAEPKNCMHHTASALYSLISGISLRVGRAVPVNPVEPAAVHMRQNMGRNYPLQFYADLCGFSQGWFTHLFREAMGMPPIAYLQSLRMLKAKELLLTTSLRIGEIAELVGYDDRLYFSRIFSQSCGVSPQAFRRIRKNEVNSTIQFTDC